MTRKPPGAPAQGEPGETAGGGAAAPGEPAGATAETTAEAPAANASPSGARSAAPVEDHAPDPPDPLNDSQLPRPDEPRPRARRSRKTGRRGLHLPRRFKGKPGAAPGIEPAELAKLPSIPGAGAITCVDYSPERVEFHDVRDVTEFIATHRPGWSVVRWINVVGLADLTLIRAIAEKYRLHPLAIEDVLHVPQRPKVYAYDETDSYQARLFIVARQIEMQDGSIHGEQVSIFVGHRTVLTFQEDASDVFDPVRQRIRTAGSQLRRNDASFLAYSLLDAIVDSCFPILESFGDRLEDLEDEVLSRPSQQTIQAIHRMKRELLLVRRAMWPMREVLGRLQRDPHECFSDVTRTYVRDVYDHVVQLIDLIETYREVANGLTETYMTAISNRMNEVMKVLTIIGTIFIPLTFLAGVYGMNFKHLPELEWWWSYPAFWARAASCWPSRWSRGSAAAAGCSGLAPVRGECRPGLGDEVAQQRLRPGVLGVLREVRRRAEVEAARVAHRRLERHPLRHRGVRGLRLHRARRPVGREPVAHAARREVHVAAQRALARRVRLLLVRVVVVGEVGLRERRGRCGPRSPP